MQSSNSLFNTNDMPQGPQPGPSMMGGGMPGMAGMPAMPQAANPTASATASTGSAGTSSASSTGAGATGAGASSAGSMPPMGGAGGMPPGMDQMAQ